MSTSLNLAQAPKEAPFRLDNPVHAEIERLADELLGCRRNWLAARAERLATEYAAHAAERYGAERSQAEPAPIAEANTPKGRLERLRRLLVG